MNTLTSTQLQQIKDYLLTKRLPTLLLQDVYEHFICQINHLQTTENLSFEMAFLETKQDWQPEFKTQRSLLSNFKKRPVIAVKYEENLQKKFLKYGLFLGLFQVTLQILTASTIDKEWYSLLQAAFYGALDIILPTIVLFLFLGYHFMLLFDSKTRKQVRSLFSVSYLLIFLFFYFKSFYLPTNSFKISYDFINLGGYGWSLFLYNLSVQFISTVTYVYLFFLFLRRLKEINTYKNFLTHAH